MAKPEFALYNKLHAAKNAQELEQVVSEAKYQTGWDLDKWKFLPMMEKSFKRKPNATWFIFIEADTAIAWSNLLAWLSHFDASEPHYLGSQNFVGDWIFGQGRSVLFVSNAAMRQLVEYRAAHLDELNELTANERAGDLVLTIAMRRAGVRFQGAWPTVQGEKPATQDYARGGMALCYPIGTYHHVLAPEIQALWRFEQEWIRGKPDQPFRLLDMFELWLKPNLADRREGWDNLSNELDEDDAPSHESFENCRAACQRKSDCKQFKYSWVLGRCKTATKIQLGRSNQSFPSGWMLDRIEQWREALEPCPYPCKWILPQESG